MKQIALCCRTAVTLLNLILSTRKMSGHVRKDIILVKNALQEAIEGEDNS